jgi:hypothetical protein
MAVLYHTDLLFDVDAVLRGQGADPRIMRERRPMLVEIAEKALAEGRPLLKPEVAYTRLAIEGKAPDRIDLAGGKVFSGNQVARLLAQAEEVIVAACTIGNELDDLTATVTDSDMVRGLALEGVGAAAVEALANWFCRQIEEEAAQDGLQTTTPLNPGMIGWPVEVGQPEIFAALDEPHNRVVLTDQSVMLPRKSLSLVIGIGEAVRAEGIVCDTCELRDRCRYRVQPSELTVRS